MAFVFNPFTGNFDASLSKLDKLDNGLTQVTLSSNNVLRVPGGLASDGRSVMSSTLWVSSGAVGINTSTPAYPLTVSGRSRFNGDVTIVGNLSATGNQYFSNTFFTTTSALSVMNFGVGPAIIVGQSGTGDIASFYDTDQNIEILHVGGQNSAFPNVGVKTSSPFKDFTVQGELSASGNIWTSGNILSGGRELFDILHGVQTADWMTLVRGYKTTPALNTTLSGGSVYNYVYQSFPADKTLYRYVANDSSDDLFYSSFVGGVLSGVVASKKFVI